MSLRALTNPYAKAATNGAAALIFMIAPHQAPALSIEHFSAHSQPAVASTPIDGAVPLTGSGSIVLYVGQSGADQTGRYVITLNDIESTSANITLEYHNCVPGDCTATVFPPYRTEITVGGHVHYASRTIGLTAVEGDSATLAVRQ